MKIGILCFSSIGGSGAVAAELGNWLARRGCKAIFIGANVPPRAVISSGNPRFAKVDEKDYPMFERGVYALALAGKIVEVCRGENLDIIHAHFAVPHAISANIAREILGANKPKVVVTLHGSDVLQIGRDPLLKEVAENALAKADAITAVSEFLANQAYEIYDIEKIIRVIPNFIDEKVFARKSEINKPNEIKKIVHISNFRPVKRVGDVLRAFAIIAKKTPARLFLAGDGPERVAAEELAMKLKIADKTHFSGAIDNPQELLADADLILAPSEVESFGMSILEAASCGVPCVATNSGGVRESVVRAKTGFLVAPGAIEEIADRALDVLTDFEKWKLFSKACRRRVEEKFRTNIVAPEYLTLYESLL